MQKEKKQIILNTLAVLVKQRILKVKLCLNFPLNTDYQLQYYVI